MDDTRMITHEGPGSQWRRGFLSLRTKLVLFISLIIIGVCSGLSWYFIHLQAETMTTSLDRNVPVLGFSSEFVRNGALAGLSINPEDIGRQAAAIAQKILNHADRAVPMSVPPDRIRLAVNLKTAKFLGLTLPPDVLGRADELY